MLRLYQCIGTQRLASESRSFLWFIEQVASPASTLISPWPLSAQKSPLQAGPRWRGKWRPQGGIGLGGGELHLNGTHWSSLLIQRKDRVPNGNVCTIQRLCAASLDRFDVGGQWALTLNPRPTPTGQYPDSCDPSEWNWVGRPLYRPCDNLLCFMPGWQS